MMALIAAKSDYIEKANLAYNNLKKHEEIFEIEAEVLSYAKCCLLRNEDLEDFYTYGTYVSVYQTFDGYELCFDDYQMYIEVYDKQIVDFDIRSFLILGRKN